jgi:hypothetical protein
MLTELRSEGLGEREHFVDLDVDGSRISKCILEDQVVEALIDPVKEAV